MTGRNDGRRISSAKVLMIGAGLLGCETAEALVARGIRHFVIFDPSSVNFRDVDGSRFRPEDVGSRYAAEITAARLVSLGASCTYQIANVRRIDGWNYEAVLCCNASYGDRMAANLRVRQYDLALVDGVVSGKRGRIQSVIPNGPCLGCLVTARSAADPGPSQPSAVSAVAEIMADEAIKMVTGRMYECTPGVIHVENGRKVILNTGISPACPFHRDGKMRKLQ